MMRNRLSGGLAPLTPLALLALLIVGAVPAVAQPAPLEWQRLSMSGIGRAAAQVDSVFVDRQATSSLITGGDWVSYLAARLGALPIPDSMGIRVSVDSQQILIRGRIRDLPEETRALFGPIQFMVDSNATLEAAVVMAPTRPGVVRFVLSTISVGGFYIPESLLSRFLANVGKQYPVLTETGRELLVATPVDGRVNLMQNGVRVWIDSTPPPPAPR